jgi:hypothetical protein
VTHADVLASGIATIAKGDKLRRVLIRHDSEKLAKVLVGLVDTKK